MNAARDAARIWPSVVWLHLLGLLYSVLLHRVEALGVGARAALDCIRQVALTKPSPHPRPTVHSPQQIKTMQPPSLLVLLVAAATATSATQLRSSTDAVSTDVIPPLHATSENTTHVERLLARSDACVVEVINVDFSGHDVGSAPGGTWQDCWAPCLRTGGCNAITFNPNTRTCWLKNLASYDAVRSVGVTSAVFKRVGDGNNCAYSMVKIKDADYFGADIANTEAGSPERCNEICYSLYATGKECRLFTWNPNGNRCYLKRENGVDLREAHGATAGVIGVPTRVAVDY